MLAGTDDTMETPVVQKLMTELVAHQEVLRAFVGAALSCYPDDIDDVVQNANLAVIRRVDDFDPARPLLPWLIAFAKRQILAFRSKCGAERLVFDEAALERLAETYVTCDSADLPVMTRLAICKRKLDEETRKMLEERYGDDRKPRELAKLHGTTSREIRNRLTYARRKLAECIMRLCRISESSFERDFGDSTELEGLMSEALDGAAEGDGLRVGFVRADARIWRVGACGCASAQPVCCPTGQGPGATDRGGKGFRPRVAEGGRVDACGRGVDRHRRDDLSEGARSVVRTV